MTDMSLRFRHEYENRMRVALVGCGEHAFRNILPALNYLPVDLVATCDVNLVRAEAYARSFGAERFFGSFDELLRWSSSAGLEAVLLVLGMRNGLPQYSDFVIPALKEGLHVWMEKPPASTVGEVEAMLAAQERTGKTVQVGYKHYFFPALVKAKEFIDSPEFGGALSIGASYPLVISPAESRSDPAKAPVDLNICHPGAAIHLLMGDIESVWFDRAPNGGGVVALRFVSGAVGVLHCTKGKSATSPNERFEVVGRGANLTVDNVVELTYYRPGKRGRPGEGYGRTPDFFGADSDAPIRWEPEFDLGQLYNMTAFLQGYVPELWHFLRSAREGIQPTHAGLRDALHLTHLYNAFRQPDRSDVRLPRIDAPQPAPARP